MEYTYIKPTFFQVRDILMLQPDLDRLPPVGIYMYKKSNDQNEPESYVMLSVVVENHSYVIYEKELYGDLVEIMGELSSFNSNPRQGWQDVLSAVLIAEKVSKEATLERVTNELEDIYFLLTKTEVC